MTGRLQGRVALITGGGQGIGRAISDTFAAEGAIVGVLDIRAEVSQQAADEINKAGGRAIPLVANVARRAEVFAAAEELRAAAGPITILVNNAMFNRYGPLAEQDEKTISLITDVGFKGVIWGYQAVVPQMREVGGGAIVNIASPSAVIAMKHGIMYAAVKAAVASATRSGAAEFGQYNIRVNAVAPGPTQTEGALRVVTDEGWERRRRQVPLGRLGQPQDVANVALFLASDEAGWVSGDMVFVDGGLTYAFTS